MPTAKSVQSAGTNAVETFVKVWRNLTTFVSTHIKNLTADTMGWIAAIILHCATVPSLLAVMAGLTDKLPQLDIVLFIWSALILLFARAIVLKDQLNALTIGIGFIGQALLLAFILFK